MQRNIGAFGGDPANVTLTGFSAGSFDAVDLMLSPLNPGLFQRAALQGIAWWPLHGANSSLPDHEAIGIGLADAFGCSAATAASCLRSVPAEDLVS